MNSAGLPPGALDGVRVIDLTQMLSGPYCTMLLRDLGADVVKVEPLDGDPTRANALAPGDTVRSYGGYFQSINRGKRSVAIDLKTAAGRDIVLRLARDADVIVENYKVGVMERFGLSYEAVQTANPRIVYACIRGFGDPRTGESPYAEWPAFDVVAQAMGGIMSMTGRPGEPMRAGPALGDIVPGMMTALGIVAAVYSASRTGRGQFLDVAMYDTVLALCEQIVYRYYYLGEVTEPSGNAHPFLCPFDVFPTSDGAVTIAAPLDHLWHRLCLLIDRPDLAGDDSLARAASRVRNAPRVREELTRWTSTRTKAEVVAVLGGKIPCGPANNILDIIADPHVAIRGMLPEIGQPGLDHPVRVPGSPIKMTETPAGPRGRGPLLGEHTDAVLAEAGFTPAEVAAFRAGHAIR
ncbi:MAG: CoA transferase [Chloroflexi bacterium]|nr:CoA transferase [Chloroflexota bacterium]